MLQTFTYNFEKLDSRVQTNCPMIAALRNPGMRDRHYKMLSEKLGFEVRATESFTVNTALKLELPKYIQILDEVDISLYKIQNQIHKNTQKQHKLYGYSSFP